MSSKFAIDDDVAESNDTPNTTSPSATDGPSSEFDHFTSDLPDDSVHRIALDQRRDGSESSDTTSLPFQSHSVDGLRKFFAFNPKSAVAFFGIILSLMLYSYLQERIMTRPYGYLPGPSGPVPVFFHHTFFLVLSNRFISAAVALAVIIRRKEWSAIQSTVPFWKYVVFAVLNIIATTLQYEVLRYITFPTQSVLKCGKVLVVIALSMLLQGNAGYSIVDFTAAAGIVSGIGMYLLSGNVSAPHARITSALAAALNFSKSANVTQGVVLDAAIEQVGVAAVAASANAVTPPSQALLAMANPNALIGLVLMLFQIVLAGLTSVAQGRLFATHSVGVWNQMLYTNAISSVIAAVFVFAHGDLGELARYLWKFPWAFFDVNMLSASALVGQFAVLFCVREFGAWVYAAIVTLRQFLSILLSNAIFDHDITLVQWCGAIVVFGMLFYRSWAKQTPASES